MPDTQGPNPSEESGGCKAQLDYRGKLLTCNFHGWDGIGHTHQCDGVYWGKDETARGRCAATASYCGEELRCSYDSCDGETLCKVGDHGARSQQYGDISWSDEKRPQPSVMFAGLGTGHRYGSYLADSMMLASATMQDAANRLEYLESKRRR